MELNIYLVIFLSVFVSSFSFDEIPVKSRTLTGQGLGSTLNDVFPKCFGVENLLNCFGVESLKEKIISLKNERYILKLQFNTENARFNKIKQELIGKLIELEEATERSNKIEIESQILQDIYFYNNLNKFEELFHGKAPDYTSKRTPDIESANKYVNDLLCPKEQRSNNIIKSKNHEESSSLQEPLIREKINLENEVDDLETQIKLKQEEIIKIEKELEQITFIKDLKYKNAESNLNQIRRNRKYFEGKLKEQEEALLPPVVNFNDLLTSLRNILYDTQELDHQYEFLYNNFEWLQEIYQSIPFSRKNDKFVTDLSSRIDETQVDVNNCNDKLVSIINRIPVNGASMQRLRVILSKASKNLVSIMNAILDYRRVPLTLKEALNTDLEDPEDETQANKKPLEDLIKDLKINNEKLKPMIEKKTFTENVRQAIKLVSWKVNQKL